jgi:hypothetical protein
MMSPFCLCIPLNFFVFHTVRAVSKKSRWLVFPELLDSI